PLRIPTLVSEPALVNALGEHRDRLRVRISGAVAAAVELQQGIAVVAGRVRPDRGLEVGVGLSVHLAEADVDCALDAALLLLAAPDVGGVDLDAATGRHLALPRGHVATADLEQLVEGPLVQHHLEGRVVPVADGLLLAATHGRDPRSGEPTRRAPAPCRRRWPAAARRRCPHARMRGSPDRGARTTPARRAGRSPAGGRNTGSCAGAASSRPSLLPLLLPDRLR